MNPLSSPPLHISSHPSCPSQLIIHCGPPVRITLSNYRNASFNLNFCPVGTARTAYFDILTRIGLGTVLSVLTAVMALLNTSWFSARPWPNAVTSSFSGWTDTQESVTRQEVLLRPLTQLLLNCSVVPKVVEASQNSLTDIISDIFKFTRIWCFNVHMQRMKMLGRFTKL